MEINQGSKPVFLKKLSLVRSCVQMVKTIFKIQKMLLIGLVFFVVVLSAQTQTIQSLIQTMRSRGIEIRDEEGMFIVVVLFMMIWSMMNYI